MTDESLRFEATKVLHTQIQKSTRQVPMQRYLYDTGVETLV
jgi:hypothetical protein